MAFRVRGELMRDQERSVAERHFAQRGECGLAEEVLRGSLRPVAKVHLAFRQALKELFG